MSPFNESPVAWKVCVLVKMGRPFDTEFKSEPQYFTFQTKEEAELNKQHQRQLHGDSAVIHVQPIYVSKIKRSRAYKAQQASLTASGWPIQKRHGAA